MAWRSIGVPPADVAATISSRLDLVAALERASAGSCDADTLESTVVGYKALAGQFGEADVVSSFVKILDALIHGLRWTEASLDADESAGLHAEACRLRAADALEHVTDGTPSGLRAAAEELAEAADRASVRRAAAHLSSVSLPPRITGIFREPDQGRSYAGIDSEQAKVPAVALLVRLHGEPVMRPCVLQPRALNSLEIEVRLDEWPVEAEAMKVSFIGVQDPNFLSAQSVKFQPEVLVQPLEIHVAGERPVGDPPLQLTTRVEFLTSGTPIQANVVGNSTIQIVTFDPNTAIPFDMPTTARRLEQMMGEMNNALPNLTTGDHRDVRLLLGGVLRFGHMVLDDRLGSTEDINEAWFQRELKSFLRADREIGARLGEKAGLAGGSTDLVLGNIVLELKVEKARGVTLTDASSNYADQAAQYASARDAQITLLAVLDVSAKRAPAGVMGNEIGWAYPELASGPSPPLPTMVGVTVIRAGFPRPSDFSRGRSRR